MERASMKTLALLVATLIVVARASAQSAIVAPIEEDFAPSVSVSGNLFVGMIQGTFDGATELNRLRIPNFSSHASTGCLVAKTRDGQFWARSKFDLPAGRDKSFAFNPEGGWKHDEELVDYQLSDFALIIRMGDDCLMDPEAPAIPARFSGGSDSQITLMINSQRAISGKARLTLVSGEVSEASCARSVTSNVRSTAFDMTCVFAVDAKAIGQGEIELSRRMRTGSRTDRITVYLPDANS
ncbi:MAG: hypothetical protein V7651_11165 [Hyphomonas oceanitis]